MNKCIAVDLDGTLSKSTNDGSIGAPVKAMVDRVKGWHGAGLTVVIFTVRAASDSGLRAVSNWLKQHGLPELHVTNVKDGEMVEFWDNRSIRIETDTGEICSRCDSARKNASSISKDYRRITDC